MFKSLFALDAAASAVPKLIAWLVACPSIRSDVGLMVKAEYAVPAAESPQVINAAALATRLNPPLASSTVPPWASVNDMSIEVVWACPDTKPVVLRTFKPAFADDIMTSDSAATPQRQSVFMDDFLVNCASTSVGAGFTSRCHRSQESGRIRDSIL
jgi:hypothetical protein